MKMTSNRNSLHSSPFRSMVGFAMSNMEKKFFPFPWTREAKKKTVVVFLQSDNSSREMLLRLLNAAVTRGDNVLAIHVQVSSGTFDPNSFHIHEDLCKSKQVEFQVKVCIGHSYISELGHQVRINYANIAAIGCSFSGPKRSVVEACLKQLPPSCTLLVLNSAGKIFLQRRGICQQGSKYLVLQPSAASSTGKSYTDQQRGSHQFKKSSSVPLSVTCTTVLDYAMKLSLPSPQNQRLDSAERHVVKKAPTFTELPVKEFIGTVRNFAFQELKSATDSFSSELVIGEDGQSTVYQATLQDGLAVAVKVLKRTRSSAEELLNEVEILSSIKHDNIVQIIGYCDGKKMNAIVYNLLEGSLKHSLRQLRWSKRMDIAIGVAKTLEYLHCCDPPIIHRDVKSSNILLSDNCQPQLSDFGAAMVYFRPENISAGIKPFGIVGTFGYLAPEYIMYGEVDEKVDVYSYGVVLLELITGKEAIQTSEKHCESLVLWARSLLSCGLYERLIDPNLNKDYCKEEMEILILAARLCLLHSSSKRPPMKMIRRLLEEPEYQLEMLRERGELLKCVHSVEERRHLRPENSACGSLDYIYDHDLKVQGLNVTGFICFIC